MKTYKTNKKAKKAVKVVFRTLNKDKAVIALMPYEKENNGMCGSYMVFGEHAPADYKGVLKISSPATMSEYWPTLKAMQSIGYDYIKVMAKAFVND